MYTIFMFSGNDMKVILCVYVVVIIDVNNIFKL